MHESFTRARSLLKACRNYPGAPRCSLTLRRVRGHDDGAIECTQTARAVTYSPRFV